VIQAPPSSCDTWVRFLCWVKSKNSNGIRKLTYWRSPQKIK